MLAGFGFVLFEKAEDNDKVINMKEIDFNVDA